MLSPDAALHKIIFTFLIVFECALQHICGFYGGSRCLGVDLRDLAAKLLRHIVKFAALVKPSDLFFVAALSPRGEITGYIWYDLFSVTPAMTTPIGQIVATSLQTEMQRSYLEYAMSVIVGRALPDVRDGLKPVHRRILFAMHELGLNPDRPFRKCARVVGDVLGKYHPHGDTAVYDALVRLAQDFASRYPLIEGHGNFGSLDNDPPAAMRYTESRLSPIAAEGLLQEVGEPMVEFQGNFDDSMQEPRVLPARLPFLVLNGANGIAVGMATNIPPHNLSEIIDGLVAMIDQPDLSLEQLLTHIPGPDFPTGGEIVGTEGIVDAYRTGRGTITLRGTVELETLRDRSRAKQALVIRELPYQVSIETLTVKIAELVNEERITGISDLRNESNRAGVRIVLELKKDANTELILNQLYRHTPLQDNFGIIQLAIVNGKPELLPLKNLLQHFLDFRLETLIRRLGYDLEQAQEKVHLLAGSLRVLANLPQAVPLILAADDTPQALRALQEAFDLSATQADHILQMPLRRLTRLDQRNLQTEFERWEKQVKELTALLNDRKKLWAFLKKDLLTLKKKFADARRTRLTQARPVLAPVTDLIADNPWLVQYTLKGYVRRVAPNRRALPEDTVQVHPGRSFSDLIVLTKTGRVYRVKFHAIPEGKVKGTLISNLVNTHDPVLTTLAFDDYGAKQTLVLLSAQGRIKRVSVADLAEISGRGLTVIKLAAQDYVVSCVLAVDKGQIVGAVSSGRLVRFPYNESQIPPSGLNTAGVQGFALRKEEHMVGLTFVQPKDEVILLTATGQAKRLAITQIRQTERAVMGTLGITFTTKTDQLVGLARYQPSQHYLGLTNTERLIPAAQIDAAERTAAGSPIFSLTAGEQLVGLLTASS